MQIEQKTNNGKTSLHIASMRGHIDILKLFIALGGDIEAKNYHDWTPLYYASYRGHIDIVKLLLDRGADIDVINIYGRTVANTAIKKVIECYEQMNRLKEWRPWNHSKYSSGYRDTMKTLVILAKQLKND